MEEKITLCGGNCIECPRYNAHSDEELRNVAELWYRVGWRDHVVSNEEIRCEGCSSHKQCTYHLVECTKEHNVDKCNQCAEFPCEKISSMLERSKAYHKIVILSFFSILGIVYGTILAISLRFRIVLGRYVGGNRICRVY